MHDINRWYEGKLYYFGNLITLPILIWKFTFVVYTSHTLHVRNSDIVVSITSQEHFLIYSYHQSVREYSNSSVKSSCKETTRNAFNFRFM